MAPLVELPLFVDSQPVHLGQFHQLLPRLFLPPRLYQHSHVKAAHKGPDAAVVVLFGQVQVVVAVVLPPVLAAGVDDRMQHPHRVGLGDAHLVQVVQDAPLLGRVGHPKQHRQQVAEHVAVVTVVAESHVRQEEGSFHQHRVHLAEGVLPLRVTWAGGPPFVGALRPHP